MMLNTEQGNLSEMFHKLNAYEVLWMFSHVTPFQEKDKHFR